MASPSTAKTPASSRRPRRVLASSSSSAPPSSPPRPWLSSERVLLTLVCALALLVLHSLVLSSVRLRCNSLRSRSRSRSSTTTTTSSSSVRSSSMRLGRRGHLFGGAWPQQNPTDEEEEAEEAENDPFYGDLYRAFQSSDTKDCSPHTLDARSIQYSSPDHKFYTTLQSLTPPFPPPVLKRKHFYQCDPDGSERIEREWSYCLPITGRHDLPYCAAPDRMDLLIPQTPETLCYSSVLHMLLVDVYAELEKYGAEPALLFGSLLGAVRNQSLIPFTEDADMGYVYSPTLRMRTVKEELWKKGYHLFRQGVLRVCVAPTHPLASNLYDPRRDSLRRSCHVPYVDIYKMQLADNRKEWIVEEIRKKRRVPMDKVKPYSQVRVNDLLFDTVADPIDFLVNEYGIQWQTPKKRGMYRVVDEGQDADLPEGPMPRMPAAFRLEDGEYDSAVDYEMPEIGEEEADQDHGEGGGGEVDENDDV